jgi:hypothetical protein
VVTVGDADRDDDAVDVGVTVAPKTVQTISSSRITAISVAAPRRMASGSAREKQRNPVPTARVAWIATGETVPRMALSLLRVSAVLGFWCGLWVAPSSERAGIGSHVRHRVVAREGGLVARRCRSAVTKQS